MITGEILDPTLLALLEIHALRQELYTDGSRRFGDAKVSSDFDFITMDEALVDDLLKRGWALSDSTKGGYLDQNTQMVVNRGQVQVILVKSIAMRERAHAYIRENGLDRGDSKVWENFYNSAS